MNDAQREQRTLDEEVRENLFQPFFTRKSHGTGLGLAIADKIVRAHGGSISAASRKGRGTTIVVSLPAVSPDLPKGPSG